MTVKQQAQNALMRIDRESARPARSISAATIAGITPNAADTTKVMALEAQAVAWRGVLTQIAAGVDPTTIILPSEP